MLIVSHKIITFCNNRFQFTTFFIRNAYIYTLLKRYEIDFTWLIIAYSKGSGNFSFMNDNSHTNTLLFPIKAVNIIKSSEKSVALFVAREIEVSNDDDSDESETSAPRNIFEDGNISVFVLALLSVII